MSDVLDGQDLSDHGNRVMRMEELQRILQDLDTLMRNTVDDINRLLEEAGIREVSGRTRMPVKGGSMTARARLQSISGALAIRYSFHDRRTRKNRTRAEIVETDAADARLLIELTPEHMKRLLDQDGRRRLLNHRFRTVYAELKSLQRLHREERNIARAMAGRAAGPDTHLNEDQ